MRRTRGLVVMTFITTILVGLGFSPQSTLAADITIANNTDYPCTREGLAAAIDAADANAIITFNCPNPTIDFFEGDRLTVLQNITIDGSNGGNPIILDGNDITGLIRVLTGKLTLQHLTLKDGSTDHGTLYVYEAAAADITDVTFDSNEASEHGGALYTSGTTTIQQSTFTSNTANRGGAIFNRGTLTIIDSRFSSNSAALAGGAIAAYGSELSTYPVDIARSTFVSNSAASGGTIFSSRGPVTITASTIKGGTATFGSVLYVGVDSLSPSIQWSTIIQSANTVPSLYLQGDLTLEGVILGGDGQHCSFSGGVLTESYTLANDFSCNLSGTGSQQFITNLGLGPLTTATLNGVEQSYYPPLEGSIAIDAGPIACDTAVDEDTRSDPDQLGTPRPQNTLCDIGAIEFIYPTFLCANRWTGALSLADDQHCGRSETLIQLPEYPTPTACANAWNGVLRLADTCSRSEHQISLTGFDTISVCVNRWTDTLRLATHCTRSEYQTWL